jgi:predicted dehydrogenase
MKVSADGLAGCKVAVIGAGSVGNHLAYSARKAHANVTVFDISDESLERMRTTTFPNRYGEFDKEINMRNIKNIGEDIFDLVFVGTPPDSHNDLLKLALLHVKKLVILEKPITTPDKEKIKGMAEIIHKSRVPILVGYNHRVGRNTALAEELLNINGIGRITRLESYVIESWNGILAAHPWLKKPSDSYLGFSELGGGAAFEHSHGLDLWRHYAEFLKLGKIVEVEAEAKYSDSSKTCDLLIDMRLNTEYGFQGSCVQSVEDVAPQKEVLVVGEKGELLSKVGGGNSPDLVTWRSTLDKKISIHCDISKTRYDDFDREISYISRILERDVLDRSPIILNGISGLETALVASAALHSAKIERPVAVNIDLLDYEAK